MVKRGQVALYLIFALVTVAMLTLLNVDTFIVYRTKMQVENAGDAAALAAARYQGELLNEIGRLNLDRIDSLLEGDFETFDEILQRQREVALLGPVEALRWADQAARANGMEPRDEFSEILREHARDVRNIYAAGVGWAGYDPYPESYPGAWMDYAAAIESVIAGGLACGPDNVEFYHAVGGHLLLNRQFYYAIAGRTWCWFHFNCEDWFNTYSNRTDWATRMPLPVSTSAHTENSEIFPLHLRATHRPITDLIPTNELARALVFRGRRTAAVFSEEELERLRKPDQCWFIYEPSKWRTWSDFRDLGLPMVGPVKPEYDVRGCSAICRTIKEAPSSALGGEKAINWCAAAKPFGCEEDEDGERVSCVAAFASLVTACFDAVRLVAIDSVGGRDLTTADASWVRHVRRHVADYVYRGIYHSDCYWCRQLRTWDWSTFLAEGRLWLKMHGDECEEWGGGTGGPGPGEDTGGGGTAHGH